MKTVPVHKDLQDLSRFFIRAGFSVYLVGGAVRDIFLGKKATDWDIATNASPQDVSALFHRIIPTGIEHGTVTIPFRGRMIECTTFRTEQGYSDGRHPDSVSYAATIEEDLSRRDFTMNAIAVSLPDGVIVDPFDGRKDITKKIIRTVGNPQERFAEDGLRTLRAVRFSTLPGFTIEPATFAAIRPALPVTARVAIERVRDELIKLVCGTESLTGLGYLESSGLLELFVPELAECRGVEQRGRHRLDVLDHSFHACAAAPREDLVVCLAALFHDVGKPRTRRTDEHGNYTFHRHESVSADMTKTVLERLRFPNRTVTDVCHLVRMHMFHYEEVWTDAAVRRFMVAAGTENLDRLFSLRRADTAAISGHTGPLPDLVELKSRIDSIMEKKQGLTLRDLAVNGSDLKNEGIRNGPAIGLILHELHEAVLDDPDLNTRDALLEIARAFCRERNIAT